MGLDASVYCDCFEKGDLKKQPKLEWAVIVDEYGARSVGATGLQIDTLIEFDAWNYAPAFMSPGNTFPIDLVTSRRLAIFEMRSTNGKINSP